MRPCTFARTGSVLAVALALLAAPALATPRLDRGFGDGGVARAPFNDRRDSLFGALRPFRQADGKVLVAAQPDPDHGHVFDTLLARFTRAGALDGSFGRRGRLRLSSHVPRQFNLLTVSTDRRGRIVLVGGVGGYAYFVAVPSRLQVIRLLPDGTPDRSFGTGGSMVWSPPWSTAGEWTSPNRAQRLPDGRLLVSASVYDPRLEGSPGYSPRTVLVRLRANGPLDGSFGQGGFAEVDTGGGYLRYWARLADGRLARIVTRSEAPAPISTPETTAWWLDTFAPVGASAAPLSPTGSVRLGLDLMDELVDLLPTRDGGLLMVGVGGDAGTVRRILPDGSLDATYGQNCGQRPLRAGTMGGAATRDGGALVSALRGRGSVLFARGADGCVAGRPLRLRGFAVGPPLLLPRGRAVVAASYPHGLYDTDLALIKIRR